MVATTFVALLALAAAPSPQAQGPGWLAFEGCWRPAEQASAPVVCFRESEGGGVMATYVDGELKSEQRIVPDGMAHALSEGGCTGEETARWSADGARLYVRARLSCGVGMDRVTTSVLALSGMNALAEVQSLRVGDGTSVRSVRYESLPSTSYPAGFELVTGRELAREAARLHASAVLDLADVIEASKQVEPAALDALLAARQSGFALNAGSLKKLAAAGVARSTIDVMVALSYPERFRVAEEEPRYASATSPYYDPFVSNPYYQYDCYGLGYYTSYLCDYRYGWSPFGYSRYGYSPYGYYSPYGGGYYGGGVIVLPGGDDYEGPGRGGTVGSSGYGQGTQTSRGTARPRSQPTSRSGPASSVHPSSGGSSTPRASSGGSSGGGSGSVGSGGYTGGGGSTSQGTAKPRGGGK